MGRLARRHNWRAIHSVFLKLSHRLLTLHHVRFTPKSRHGTLVGCPLCAKRRHSHCSDLRSAEVLIEKFACSSVRQCCRGRIVVQAVMPGERVTLTRITVNDCVRLFCQRRFDLRLRLTSLNWTPVLLKDRHRSRSPKLNIFFGRFCKDRFGV